MTKPNLTAPFPYFGGKSSVAAQVWGALGNVKHYIEPFFGSGAVLLARPGHDPARHVETICDKDGYVCNVWRALQSDPDGVAKVCDWPVNHTDLLARRKVLIDQGELLLEKLIADPDYCDARLAGYWIWAACCWIGSGLVSPGRGDQRPHIGCAGRGVHTMGKGRTAGRGGEPVDVREPYSASIYAWFRRLSERLRYVRVVCGDWVRVCGGNWQDSMGTCGMFFDPPYGVQDRSDLYHEESYGVAHEVRRWCLERGDNPSYRIVLAGYEEHEELVRHGWRAVRYSVAGGYGNTARRGESRGKANRHRERLYFSPHCLDTESQLGLFQSGEVAHGA